MKSNNEYSVQPFTLERKLVEDANRIGQTIPFIHGIFDADITEVRSKIKELRNSKKINLSLSAYLLHCFVSTINETKQVQACKSWNNKVYTFNEVDVFFPIELENKTVKPHIVRSANQLKALELEQNIISAKKEEKIKIDSKQKTFMTFPSFLRILFYKYWMKRPLKRKLFFGTAYFSAGGMFSKGQLWGIPIPMQTIGLFVGTIEKKPVFENNTTTEKEFICLTLSVDHSIVDGAQQARFISRLKQNIATLIDQI